MKHSTADDTRTYLDRAIASVSFTLNYLLSLEKQRGGLDNRDVIDILNREITTSDALANLRYAVRRGA